MLPPCPCPLLCPSVLTNLDSPVQYSPWSTILKNTATRRIYYFQPEGMIVTQWSAIGSQKLWMENCVPSVAAFINESSRSISFLRKIGFHSSPPPPPDKCSILSNAVKRTKISSWTSYDAIIIPRNRPWNSDLQQISITVNFLNVRRFLIYIIYMVSPNLIETRQTINTQPVEMYALINNTLLAVLFRACLAV